MRLLHLRCLRKLQPLPRHLRDVRNVSDLTNREREKRLVAGNPTSRDVAWAAKTMSCLLTSLDETVLFEIFSTMSQDKVHQIKEASEDFLRLTLQEKRVKDRALAKRKHYTLQLRRLRQLLPELDPTFGIEYLRHVPVPGSALYQGEGVFKTVAATVASRGKQHYVTRISHRTAYGDERPSLCVDTLCGTGGKPRTTEILEGDRVSCNSCVASYLGKQTPNEGRSSRKSYKILFVVSAAATLEEVTP